jgi:hypothetical protein
LRKINRGTLQQNYKQKREKTKKIMNRGKSANPFNTGVLAGREGQKTAPKKSKKTNEKQAQKPKQKEQKSNPQNEQKKPKNEQKTGKN